MFRRLSTLLGGAARRIGVERQVEAHAVLAATNEALGRIEHAQAAHAYRYTQARIWVSVDHPGVAELIHQREGELLNELRRAFPRLSFEGVRFTVRR